MSQGRLQSTVCWFTPRKDGDWNWNKKEMIKAGFNEKRTLVYVEDHTFTVEGRISNWVTFSIVEKGGVIRKDSWGAYDYGQFKPAKEYKSTVKVVRSVHT